MLFSDRLNGPERAGCRVGLFSPADPAFDMGVLPIDAPDILLKSRSKFAKVVPASRMPRPFMSVEHCGEFGGKLRDSQKMIIEKVLFAGRSDMCKKSGRAHACTS